MKFKKMVSFANCKLNFSIRKKGSVGKNRYRQGY